MAPNARPWSCDKTPGTFSQTSQRARVRPASRRNSSVRLPRTPAKPARSPATLKSWQGVPPSFNEAPAFLPGIEGSPQPADSALRIALFSRGPRKRRRTRRIWFRFVLNDVKEPNKINAPSNASGPGVLARTGALELKERQRNVAWWRELVTACSRRDRHAPSATPRARSTKAVTVAA